MSERLSDDRLAEIRRHRNVVTPDKIDDLLAEVDRLRALLRPDPSEEERLASLRQMMANLQNRDSPWVEDVAYLLDRLNALGGILADALSESGARQAGAAEERRRCLAALEAERSRWPNNMPGVGETVLGYCCDALASLPELPAPLPPEAARIRADKMEVMLRQFLEESPEGVEGTVWHGLKAEARKLLGED